MHLIEIRHFIFMENIGINGIYSRHSISHHLTEIIKKLENGALSKDEIVLLGSWVGKYLSKRIYQKICNTKGRYHAVLYLDKKETVNYSCHSY